MSTLPLVPASTARLLLLSAQGLASDPRGRVTTDSVYELIHRMGFVQLDSIRTVERAHDLTLAARLERYRPEMLERLVDPERRLFEHWTHDASSIPTAFLPYWRRRFGRHREKILANRWWRARLGADWEAGARAILERLRVEGPLLVRDFTAEAQTGDEPKGSGGWWGWQPHKATLELLWHCGQVAISGRANFHKIYDLPERVFPDLEALPEVSDEKHLDWACRSALERLGTATPRELAAFWNAVKLPEAQAWSEAAEKRGEAVPVTVERADGGAPYRALAVPDWQERARDTPPPPGRLRALSPFDPILRDRRRSLRLFGFDYRFEAFVPAAKRQYGYYVMPLLEGDRLVGRMDPKFHRDRGELAVRAVWWEPKVRPRPAALEQAVVRLARFLGAETYSLPAR